jgi:hypothetical protein
MKNCSRGHSLAKSTCTLSQQQQNPILPSILWKASNPKQYIFFILCSVSMWGWEVIVCFVNIGGIVDHHSLNFLFLLLYQHNWKVNAEYMLDPNNWHILLHMEKGVVNRYQDKTTLYFDWLYF